MKTALVFAALVVAQVCGHVYFKEAFHDGWRSHWVDAKLSGKEQGEFKHTAGQWYGDAEEDKGIQTSQDARFYAISSLFKETFDNKGKDLVFQFSVKHEQKIDCGGGYMKIVPKGLDQKGFNGDSKYYVMFGPDICGPGTRKVHVIFNYKDKNHLIKRDITCETDQLSHMYTLILHPDQTYEVKIDGVSKRTGKLEEDWDFLPEKEIKDPAQSKPKDWVDEAEIADPKDVKPAGWDDIPEMIPDADAKKPEDWDDELDGEWEAPLIDNPEYKGEWKAAMIPNPDYKGPWVHPMIANPEYEADSEIYQFSDMGGVAMEIWQVKAGSIFDNVLVTDSTAEAEKEVKDFLARKEGEKKMFDKAEEERKAKEEEERKVREEERKKRDEEERKKREEEEAEEDEEEDDKKDEL